MTFDYDIEDADGEIVATVSVTAEFEPEVDAFLSGPPERCHPPYGGDLIELDVYLRRENITATVDEQFGAGTYDRIAQAAKEKNRWRR